MKKLFALILTVAMLATMSTTAFAATVDQGSTDPNGSMTVTYSVAPAYTVTIPETVTIGASSTSAEISAADVVVDKGQYVSVTLAADNNFTVKTTEGAELPYTVTANGDAVAAGGEILAVNPTDGKTGTATITFDIDETKIQYAGTYTGTATFTIAVKDAPKTIINFTIDGTSYQAEAGMTWAQWVADPAYNTVGLEKDGEWYIVDPSTNKAVFKGKWETCNPSDVIVADYEYSLGWIME